MPYDGGFAPSIGPDAAGGNWVQDLRPNRKQADRRRRKRPPPPIFGRATNSEPVQERQVREIIVAAPESHSASGSETGPFDAVSVHHAQAERLNRRSDVSRGSRGSPGSQGNHNHSAENGQRRRYRYNYQASIHHYNGRYRDKEMGQARDNSAAVIPRAKSVAGAGRAGSRLAHHRQDDQVPSLPPIDRRSTTPNSDEGRSRSRRSTTRSGNADAAGRSVSETLESFAGEASTLPTPREGNLSAFLRQAKLTEHRAKLTELLGAATTDDLLELEEQDLEELGLKKLEKRRLGRYLEYYRVHRIEQSELEEATKPPGVYGGPSRLLVERWTNRATAMTLRLGFELWQSHLRKMQLRRTRQRLELESAAAKEAGALAAGALAAEMAEMHLLGMRDHAKVAAGAAGPRSTSHGVLDPAAQLVLGSESSFLPNVDEAEMALPKAQTQISDDLSMSIDASTSASAPVELLSERCVAKARQLFEILDGDGDGFISAARLLAQSKNLPDVGLELDFQFVGSDTDSEGRTSFENLCAQIAVVGSNLSSAELEAKLSALVSFVSQDVKGTTGKEDQKPDAMINGGLDVHELESTDVESVVSADLLRSPNGSALRGENQVAMDTPAGEGSRLLLSNCESSLGRLETDTQPVNVPSDMSAKNDTALLGFIESETQIVPVPSDKDGTASPDLKTDATSDSSTHDPSPLGESRNHEAHSVDMSSGSVATPRSERNAGDETDELSSSLETVVAGSSLQSVRIASIVAHLVVKTAKFGRAKVALKRAKGVALAQHQQLVRHACATYIQAIYRGLRVRNQDLLTMLRNGWSIDKYLPN